MHEGLRFPCDKCEYTASCNGNLRKHIESKHEGVRYPCDKCEYSAYYNVTPVLEIQHPDIISRPDTLYRDTGTRKLSNGRSLYIVTLVLGHYLTTGHFIT